MSSTDNPYRPPSATVADIPAQGSGTAFAVPGATVEAGHGVAWISEGWALFKAAPVMWIVALLIMFGLQFALGLVPFLGNLAAILLGPVFMAGMLAFAHGIAEGEEADIGKLFAGFKTNFGSLATIGALYFVLLLGLIVVFLGAGFLLLGGAVGLASGNPDQMLSTLLAGGGLMGLLLLFLVFFAVMMLVLAAYWFAPGLVFFAGMDAWPAMKESFRVCLRNWLPFLVYSVISLLVLLGGMVVLVVGVFLLSMPILMASYYSSFRDLFGRKA